ncbi:MAG: NAD(P)-dependent oxidoreductase [Eubacterium sp.]|nr:NAD(P)-dependent oxidoreductase [Eubacterium sp.]
MLQIKAEAERCLQCKKARCSAGCPVSTDIPKAIQLLKERKMQEAAQMLFENNPLSVICALVCNHQSQCEGHCVRAVKGEAVAWGEIERYISDMFLDRIELAKAPATGRKAAIIGSGPAGITAAILLAQKGHDVTVFEAESQLGGMLRYGIPEFRLPNSILDRYTALMKRNGIHIRLHTAIGVSLTIPDLFRDGYDAVFIGSGLWRARPLNVPGESLPNVCYGIHYLSSPDSFDIGTRLAVIGTGNTALDVARTALHRGAEYVTLYARRTQSAADPREIELAELEGAQFHHGMQIVRFTPEGPVFRKSHLNEAGEIVSLDSEELLEPADFTIIAASQGPKSKLIQTTDGLQGEDSGLLKIDDNGQTTVAGVFAAGDVVHGGRTVVEAVAGAKKTVLAMDAYLRAL